jgi:type VI secretion system protein VasD
MKISCNAWPLLAANKKLKNKGNMNMTRILHIALLTGILLTETACTAVNSGVGGYFGMDTDLKISFVADADINPDENKKPSPLYIRMYELKSTKMFNKADFISLYERDKEIIGADFIAVQKLKPLKPGDTRDDFLVLDNSTTYVALYAEFLQYKDAVYRVVIPIATTNLVSSSAKIRISANTLKIIDGSADEKFDDRSPDSAKTTPKNSKPPAKKEIKPAFKGDDIF